MTLQRPRLLWLYSNIGVYVRKSYPQGREGRDRYVGSAHGGAPVIPSGGGDVRSPVGDADVSTNLSSRLNLN